MPVDLKQAGLSKRFSLLIAEDCLFVLRHGIRDDRIHRLMFDKVESLATYTSPAWSRVLFGALIMVGAGLWVLSPSYAFLPGAVILAVFGAVIALYGLLRRRATVQIFRDGKAYRYRVVAARFDVERFERKFFKTVNAWQKRLAARRAAEAAAFFGRETLMPPPNVLPPASGLTSPPEQSSN